MVEYRLRPARREDAKRFLELLDELARFERLDPPVGRARQRLVRDGFGAKRRFDPFMISHGDEDVGYAFVVWTYSSFLARPTLFLEDIYLAPGHRGTGAAALVLGELARLARRKGAARLDGVVLNWNKRARRFYQKTGAKELPEWILFRYTESALEKLARPPSRVGRARLRGGSRAGGTGRQHDARPRRRLVVGRDAA
jgi:GNAT superfamily N-acetyltransferase